MSQSTIPQSQQDKGEIPRASSSCHEALSWVGWFVKDQWFLISLLLLILISSQVQVPSSQQVVKHQVVNNLAVAIIFFINGCTTPTQLLIENGKRWKEHILIQLMCFGFASATAFAVVSAAATKQDVLDPALLNGVVLLGCLPTALAFNTVMTRKSNGNAALTLTESVLGSILGPVITTLLMQGYSSRKSWYTAILPKSEGGYSEVFRSTFKQLGLTLFVPLVVGQIVLYVLPKATETIFTRYQARRLASLSLLALIWSACDSAFETGAMAALGRTNIVFAVFLAVALFLLWAAAAMLASLAYLPREDVISAMFCVSTKTPALGLPLISTVFAGLGDMDAAKLTVPMVLFQCVQTCLSSLATIPLRRWRVPKSADPEATEVGSEDSGSGADQVPEASAEKCEDKGQSSRTPARLRSGGFDNPVEYVGL